MGGRPAKGEDIINEGGRALNVFAGGSGGERG